MGVSGCLEGLNKAIQLNYSWENGGQECRVHVICIKWANTCSIHLKCFSVLHTKGITFFSDVLIVSLNLTWNERNSLMHSLFRTLITTVLPQLEQWLITGCLQVNKSQRCRTHSKQTFFPKRTGPAEQDCAVFLYVGGLWVIQEQHWQGYCSAWQVSEEKDIKNHSSSTY